MKASASGWKTATELIHARHEHAAESRDRAGYINFIDGGRHAFVRGGF